LQQLACHLGIGRTDSVRRAPAGDSARTARGLAGMTGTAAMPDEPMRQHGPVLLREQRADFMLDLDGVFLEGPSESAGQPPEVGVNGDAGNAERVSQHDIRRLEADTR